MTATERDLDATVFDAVCSGSRAVVVTAELGMPSRCNDG